MGRLTTEQFIEKAVLIHGDRYSYDSVDYITVQIPVKIFCNKCQKYFMQRPDKHLMGHGCPKCRQSKGEEQISLFLDKNNIEYVSQKIFKECCDINPLPFDFYIPLKNICIEFQGRQHYEIVRHNFKESGEKLQKDLEDRQRKDLIKREYCKNNGIILIEIKYSDNIEKILKGVIL